MFAKRILTLMLCGALVFSFSGCDKGDDVKTISKEAEPDAAAAEGGADNAGEQALSGYVFDTGKGEVAVDMPMEEAMAALGTEKDYFEAASCAFQGQLDKTYTYDHFEVKTYPSEDGSKDFVSYINLFDDTVSTQEGVYIGDDVEKVKEAYGEGYTESGSALVYENGGMKLQFLVEDGKVTGITYLSSILDP